MSLVAPVPTISTAGIDPIITRLGVGPVAQPTQVGGFADILASGLKQVESKLSTADNLVRQFALDDSSVPVHQVTYALEQARLSVELAMQVRTRLVEGYRELMNMQL